MNGRNCWEQVKSTVDELVELSLSSLQSVAPPPSDKGEPAFGVAPG
jgi:hypothetical protein